MRFRGRRAYTKAPFAYSDEPAENSRRHRNVDAFDPAATKEAKRIWGDRPDLALCARARETLEGADALCIVTEWKEFRSPDFDNLKKQLKTPTIFDGRNLYDPALMKKQGFKYYAIGRGEGAGS